MIDWLKQQYNDLVFKMFPVMPSYILRECHEEFDKKYWEFRVMTENKRYEFDVMNGGGYVVGYSERMSDDISFFTRLCEVPTKTQAEKVCNELKGLQKENEQLKIRFREEKDTAMRLGSQCDTLTIQNQELKDKYNEQSVSYEGLEEQVERLLDFKDKVFNLINGKIKQYSHKPVSAPISQPLSVNFDADMDRLARLSELEALKEELTE